MLKRIIVMDRIRKSTLFMRTVLITCLCFSFAFITTSAQEKGLITTYHVYVDGDHIGEVDDKGIVQQVINEKVLETLNEYEDMNIALEESVSMIPEKVFTVENNNEHVKEYLEENLTVIARAVEIKVDDKTVGYFNNEETANEILRTYKLKYIDEKELTKIENMKDEIEEEKLSVGDTMITDIKFSKEVSILEKDVLPESVLNIEQGVRLLEKGTLEEKVHKVGEGEVLGEIAKKYDLSTKKLLTLNPSLTEGTILQINQEVNVTEYEPFVNVLVFEDRVVEEKINYETEIIETEDMYKGEEEIKQEGKNGKKEVQYRVEKINDQVSEKIAVDETVVEKPTDKIVIKGTKVIPSRGSGDLSWPADGGYVSSHFGARWGSMHKGIDIARPSSQAIFAADHGVVESAGWNNGGYGNKVVITHNNGMRTIYAHLSSIDVKSGQVVEKGTQIGVMGSTGNSTGVHLHFEVYVDDQLKDPMDYY